MPLADELEKDGFVMRMNSWCKERTGKTLQELDIIIEQEVAFPVNKDELSKLVTLHD